MKGWDIHWGGRGLEVVFPDFHPSSIFPREAGIFVLFSFDQKHHGISAR